ncbi:hypothetical protein OG555_14630 [Kribbella sp. NBC_01484]|uniref:hypothetical protein n=1 Tax=Kribbella sp. NBC_01484 TaxID=2903579 RepID=UPI002E32E70D|nr:hypothetical protein [Kribbella sp. NBC_01484]
MADLPEHEGRAIRDYVNSQSPDDDQAGLVQKVGSKRILSRVHDLYDVHCTKTRWWVITDPTNLYLQDDFPEVEQALIFHLGLGLYLTERSRVELEEEKEEHISGAWRRYTQAVEDMDTASESEDYQSVGIKCRDALIALAKDHAEDDWIGELDERPKAADFKGWGGIFAERLAEGRLRSYVKALVEKTWDLTVWLQHHSDATPDEADLVLTATHHLLGTLSVLMLRRASGPPERCPRCASYRLDSDLQVVEEPEAGYYESTVCGACGWRSEPVFESWAEHFDGADIEGYLSKPPTGISDRLHRKERRDAEEQGRSEISASESPAE